MTSIKLTEDQIRLEIQIKSVGQIARDNGVSTTAMSTYIKKLGLGDLIKKQKKQLDEVDIINRYKNGESGRSISLLLKVDYRTIKRILDNNAIQIIHPGKRSFELNDGIFKEIDTKEKAYWLGFLLADGHLTKKCRIRVCLAKYDEHLLHWFVLFIGCEKPDLKDSKARNPQLLFQFQSVKIGKDLEDLGFYDWKDGTNTRIIDRVPKNIFNHFVRGYFDGDGSISYRRHKLNSGSYGNKLSWVSGIACKFENNLMALAEFIPVASVVNQRSDGDYYLNFTNKENTINFGQYLYHDANDLFLDRKKVRFDCLNGVYPFYMRTVHDFHIPHDANRNLIEDQFIECLLRTGWKNKRKNFTTLFESTIKSLDTICDSDLKVSQNPDNDLIEHCQPWINWIVLNKATPIALFRDKPNYIKRAVKAFLEKGSLNPERLIREMRFVGFSRASLFSSATMIRIIRHFKLNGFWFDPCAGWGNRLLTAYYMNLEYSACDPGICFDGLKYLNNKIGNYGKLQNFSWQKAVWPESCDFVFTSPPFYNKENYLDNVNYGSSFDDWCNTFLKPLVEKSVKTSKKVLFHVDGQMSEFLNTIGGESHELSLPNRSKTSKEFIHVFDQTQINK